MKEITFLVIIYIKTKYMGLIFQGIKTPFLQAFLGVLLLCILAARTDTSHEESSKIPYHSHL